MVAKKEKCICLFIFKNLYDDPLTLSDTGQLTKMCMLCLLIVLYFCYFKHALNDAGEITGVNYIL